MTVRELKEAIARKLRTLEKCRNHSDRNYRKNKYTHFHRVANYMFYVKVEFAEQEQKYREREILSVNIISDFTDKPLLKFQLEEIYETIKC